MSNPVSIRRADNTYEDLQGREGAALVKDGNRAYLGYQKITALSSAASLTVPDGAGLALLRTEGQDIRFLDGGATPTATDGMLLKTTDGIFPFTGSLTGFRAIQVSASATLHVMYYR